jgi:hypothetical protein
MGSPSVRGVLIFEDEGWRGMGMGMGIEIEFGFVLLERC